jgi:hypothetical protein
MEEEITKNTKIGRPKKLDSELVVFKSYNFYFPKDFKDIMSEFNKICIRKMGDFPYEERCKSIFIRRLICQFVNSNTANDELKSKIKEFLKNEDEYLHKLKENYSSRRRQ